MIFNLHSIVSLEMQYRYAFLFPATIIEGPIVTIIGGFLASSGYFNPYLVYVVAILGDALGDSVLYLIGRFSRRPVIGKLARRIGVGPERIHQLEMHFAKHTVETLLIGKAAHGAGALVLAAAGAARVRYVKFLGVNFLATLVKSAVFVLLGYYFGKEYERANSVLNVTALITVMIVIVFVLVYALPRKVRRMSRLKDEHTHVKKP